jgi:hypothetical protein
MATVVRGDGGRLAKGLVEGRGAALRGCATRGWRARDGGVVSPSLAAVVLRYLQVSLKSSMLAVNSSGSGWWLSLRSLHVS